MQSPKVNAYTLRDLRQWLLRDKLPPECDFDMLLDVVTLAQKYLERDNERTQELERLVEELQSENVDLQVEVELLEDKLSSVAA